MIRWLFTPKDLKFELLEEQLYNTKMMYQEELDKTKNLESRIDRLVNHAIKESKKEIKK